MSLTSTSGRQSTSVSYACAADVAQRTSARASASRCINSSHASRSSSTTSTRTPSSRASATGAVVVASTMAGRSRGGRSSSWRGSCTKKRAPWPRPALSARIVPPCSSTSCFTMARPRPRPPCSRVLELSACRKRSNTCGRNAGSMPRPVSLTATSTNRGRDFSSTRTRPSRSVNLMAFDSRFHITCCRRPASPRMRSTSGSSASAISMPRASAAGRTVATAASITSASRTGSTSSRTLPETIALMSSRSSMIWVCTRALRSIASRPFASDGSAAVRRSTCTQPRIGVIGVRSSCDSVATNSSFMRLARSASARAWRSLSSSAWRCVAASEICALCAWICASISLNASVRTPISSVARCSARMP